jgi:beta-N-acetylhexosaminidase
LKDRSYGPDADFTKRAAAAFVAGMDRAGVLCVAKHFPGNAGDDPHQVRTVLDADRQNLDRIVEPFAKLIQHGKAPAVMVSHIVVPARDSEHNASLSSIVINDWLRQEIGFTGIAVADDFSMGAVASTGLREKEAAVEALKSGIDMVMVWPRSLASTHAAILSSLKGGNLSRERLEEAAGRIIFQKLRYGIIKDQ